MYDADGKLLSYKKDLSEVIYNYEDEIGVILEQVEDCYVNYGYTYFK